MLSCRLWMYSFIGHVPASSKASSANDHSHHPPILSNISSLKSADQLYGGTPPTHNIYFLSDPTPLLHVAEAHPLSEMAKKANQSKRRQENFHLLVPWGMKDANVRVQVHHDDRVPTWEAVARLLKIWNVIKIGQGEVRYNDRGLLWSGNYFADNHVHPVEARGFNNPYLQKLPNDQTHSPLLFRGRGAHRLVVHSHHIVVTV